MFRSILIIASLWALTTQLACKHQQPSVDSDLQFFGLGLGICWYDNSPREITIERIPMNRHLMEAEITAGYDPSVQRSWSGLSKAAFERDLKGRSGGRLTYKVGGETFLSRVNVLPDPGDGGIG